MVDEITNFIEKKEDVLNNIATLRFMLDKCIEIGYNDLGSNMYNIIDDTDMKASSSRTKEEIEEFIIQAKSIEHQLDSYLSTKGETTLSLEWPTF